MKLRSTDQARCVNKRRRRSLQTLRTEATAADAPFYCREPYSRLGGCSPSPLQTRLREISPGRFIRNNAIVARPHSVKPMS